MLLIGGQQCDNGLVVVENLHELDKGILGFHAGSPQQAAHHREDTRERPGQIALHRHADIVQAGLHRHDGLDWLAARLAAAGGMCRDLLGGTPAQTGDEYARQSQQQER